MNQLYSYYKHMYIEINESAFTLLNNIKASDEKWVEFNLTKGLERLRNKVYTRTLSLTSPKNTEYDLITAKLNNNELHKMSDIPEDTEEAEEEKSEMDYSYDKCDEFIKPTISEREITHNTINKVQSEETIATQEFLPVDKSTELPKRRTFIDMFSYTHKLSKSYDKESSFADKKVSQLFLNKYRRELQWTAHQCFRLIWILISETFFIITGMGKAR